MSEQVAEISQTVGGNEYLGRLEQEMDRRLAEAARTKSLRERVRYSDFSAKREKPIFKDATGRLAIGSLKSGGVMMRHLSANMDRHLPR